MASRSYSRRDVLKAVGAAPLALQVRLKADPTDVVSGFSRTASAQTKDTTSPIASAHTSLCLVSRHLQWTDIEEGVSVAAEAGCKAIAWTVRQGAHMVPENVERDLPRAVAAARKAGLETPMVITALTDAKSARAEAILDTLRGLGIRYYRAAPFRYDYAQDLLPQIEALKPRVASLVALNEKYGTTSLYHTHSGTSNVGGGVWDLWMVLQGFDPRHVGINYDLGHATIRGGTGWIQTSRIARKFIHGLSVKDFRWVKGQGGRGDLGEWSAEMVPPGEGMVDFKGMFAYFKSSGFTGPIELYQEYRVDVPGRAQPVNMLGTDYGTWKLEMTKAQYVTLLRRDVNFYTSALAEAGLL